MSAQLARAHRWGALASDISLNLSWVSLLPDGATSGCMVFACCLKAALMSACDAVGSTPNTANQLIWYILAELKRRASTAAAAPRGLQNSSGSARTRAGFMSVVLLPVARCGEVLHVRSEISLI